jgi:putative acetyltransferase
MHTLDRQPRIRLFEPADLDEILRLFRDTVRTVNRRDYSAEQVAAWAPDAPDREAWLARLSAPWTLVAEDGDAGEGAIVGFGQLRPDGRVDLLYVHAGRQRQGIGSRLLGRLVEQAHDHDHALQQLSVGASLTARTFFVRHGFTAIAEQRVCRRGVEFVNFLMGRAI